MTNHHNSCLIVPCCNNLMLVVTYCDNLLLLVSYLRLKAHNFGKYFRNLSLDFLRYLGWIMIVLFMITFYKPKELIKLIFNF